MEELDAAIQSKELGNEPNWGNRAAVVRRFLTQQRIGDLGAPEVSQICQRVLVHGDLHARNILVSQSGPPVPVIIDWSDFGPGHWASDFARFVVDLLVSVYDHGVKSFLWDELPSWREAAEGMTKGQQLSTMDNSNKGTVRAINWMFQHMAQICPAAAPESMWELQLAMAVEYMRSSYRSDLTAPKRALGLLASYDALKIAESSFGTRRA